LQWFQSLDHLMLYYREHGLFRHFKQ
jgi:hypothetical protein